MARRGSRAATGPPGRGTTSRGPGAYAYYADLFHTDTPLLRVVLLAGMLGTLAPAVTVGDAAGRIAAVPIDDRRPGRQPVYVAPFVVAAALDVLADARLEDRSEVWR